MICYYWHHGDWQTGYCSVCSLVVWEWGWVWFLFMCHNILSFYQNTSMIITTICCRCVAMWKEGEESSTAHTYNYMYKCTHTHTIFTHHTSSHDGLHQTWNNRVMSSMHKQCTRGEFFTIFLSCSYVSITMVKEVSWWDYWSQLTALTEESFSR